MICIRLNARYTYVCAPYCINTSSLVINKRRSQEFDWILFVPREIERVCEH